jgi:proteasome accessory factor B
VDRRERLLNLLAALLDTTAGLTVEEILSEASLGYGGTGESARKAFERDKASLRAMGVPLEQMDHERDYRYRVDPKSYYLPDLGLTNDESAALHLAVTAISLGGGEGEGALMKLGGREGERAQPVAALPIAPALAPVFEASRRRTPVRFGYRGERRHVEPWGLSSKRGRWYVVGFDRDREQMRVFRADRIEGDVDLDDGDTFSVPDGFRPEAELAEQAWELTGTEPRAVRVAVDATHATDFVTRAGRSATVEWRDDGSAVVSLPVTNVDGLRAFVLEYLEHAEVLDPPEVRADIIGWLEAVAAAGPEPRPGRR